MTKVERGIVQRALDRLVKGNPMGAEVELRRLLIDDEHSAQLRKIKSNRTKEKKGLMKLIKSL